VTSRPENDAALAKYAHSVDRNKWLSVVEERFGIPAEVFDPYLVVRPSASSLHLVLREHTPPHRPEPQIVGMSFMRTRMRFPKLTTAAAMAFGAHATKNHVALSRDQADRFLSREPLEVSPAQTAACTGTGYVLVRVDEVVLGIGLFRQHETGGSIKSLLPKAWTLAEDESAFEN
jgi:NOL1/NOP2/fmu family ribosome biogenesis protein